MKRLLAAQIFLMALLTGAIGSCRKKIAPPPPAPAVIVLPKPEPPAPAPLPPAPTIETTPPSKPPIPEIPPPPPPPKKKAPAPRKKASPKKTAVEAPKPEAPKPEAPKADSAETAPPPATPPAPAPKFGQILTREQVRDLNRRFEAAAERTRTSLLAIQTKTLNEEHKETLSRIRAFLAQAEQARSQDLLSAVSLAERADLLSRDLLDRLR